MRWPSRERRSGIPRPGPRARRSMTGCLPPVHPSYQHPLRRWCRPIGRTVPAPSVWTTMTWSPGTRPVEGSCPSFRARPTTAFPPDTGRCAVTSPGVNREPAGTVTAAQVPESSSALDTGMVASPPELATWAVPRSAEAMRSPCWMVDVATRTGTRWSCRRVDGGEDGDAGQDQQGRSDSGHGSPPSRYDRKAVLAPAVGRLRPRRPLEQRGHNGTTSEGERGPDPADPADRPTSPELTLSTCTTRTAASVAVVRGGRTP